MKDFIMAAFPLVKWIWINLSDVVFTLTLTK